MLLSFEKWHGCRNDFIVIHHSLDPTVVASIQRKTPKWCSRNGTGVGADGVILIHPPHESGDIELRIINSDGSEAATCGNGIRCAAASMALLARKTGAEKERLEGGVSFQLPSGEVHARYLDKKGLFIAVDMGAAVPLKDPALLDSIREALKDPALGLASQLIREVYLYNILNDHLVLLSDDAAKLDIHTLGPMFQKLPPWMGINVHLIEEIQGSNQQEAAKWLPQPVSEAYQAVIWERGAGATAACGSGACAIGAAMMDQGFIEENSWVAVEMPGGPLFVKKEDDHMVLAGPAEFVFAGELEL